MEWIKKHADTVMVLGGMFSGLLWINGKFNDLDRRLVKIEIVMMMKGMTSQEVAPEK